MGVRGVGDAERGNVDGSERNRTVAVGTERGAAEREKRCLMQMKRSTVRYTERH